ncbi:MAG: hypothetical protein ABWZ66_07635 [Pyrinomonadaceae bacterium]
MSLLEQQNFLARLYTDENLRKSFLAEPEKIGLENDLTEPEIAGLSAIIPEELNFFADSLVWKRLREVEKMLPLTRKALNESFEEHFREFSQNYNPKSVKKHLEDAIGFCSFLQNCEIEPVWAKDLAKFEQARLIFNSKTKDFLLRKFDFDVKEISREDTKARSEFSMRRTFAVWIRVGNKSKHFVW